MKIRHFAGRVYIWYPHGEQVGHCSMHIGAHQEVNSTDWYASWWPQGDNVLMENSEMKTYNGDLTPAGEGGPPHVEYQIYGLDVNAMKVAWDAIRTKPGSHYDLFRKSCSTIVARLLRAGGASDSLNIVKKVSYGRNLYWTPKDVAQLCNQLRDKGMATKHKHHSCPTKGKSKVSVVFGLR